MVFLLEIAGASKYLTNIHQDQTHTAPEAQLVLPENLFRAVLVDHGTRPWLIVLADSLRHFARTLQRWTRTNSGSAIPGPSAGRNPGHALIEVSNAHLAVPCTAICTLSHRVTLGVLSRQLAS